MSTKSKLAIIFGLATFLRLLLIPHPGFLADIAYWKWWTKDSAQNGIVHTVTSTGINYPPLYLVVMKATGHVYSLFGNMEDHVFWDKSNLLFLFLIKLPYIAADLTIGFLIYWFTRRFTSGNLPLFSASLWLFNPGTIYNSALWGQTDSIGVLPILLAFMLAVLDRPILAAVLAGAAFFLKAQSIPLIILLYLFLFLKYGLTQTAKAAATSTATGLILTSPFLIAHAMDRIISTIFTSVGYFPYASLYAFNLWWLVIKGVNFQFPDTTLVLGLLSYRTIGFTLFWSAFAILSFILWKTKDKISQLFVTASLLILSAFLLPTEIHERYLLPFFAYFPIAFAFTIKDLNRLKDLKKLIYLLCLSLLSLSWVLNLHFVMIQNYPENELPIFSLFSPYLPALGLLFSFSNLAVFLFLFFLLIKSEISYKFRPLVILLPILLLSAQAIPVALAVSVTPVSLTKLKPTYSTQQYGSLNYNKSVLGNNLSVYYFFSKTGLGTHANSQIDYSLNGAYTKIDTDVGVDSDGTDSATVVFQIYGDGKILANSGVIKKWQPPTHLSADLTGVNKLSLIVKDASDGNSGDHADWLYPILYK